MLPDGDVVDTELQKPEEHVEPELKPIPEYVEELVTKAKRASGKLAALSTAVKNQALLAMAEALEAKTEELLAANEKDLESFGVTPEKKAMADRLRLTEKRIAEMAAGIREVAKLPDPLGMTPSMWTRPKAEKMFQPVTPRSAASSIPR